MSGSFGPPHILAGAEDGFVGRLEKPFRWLPYPMLAASLLLTVVAGTPPSSRIPLGSSFSHDDRVVICLAGAVLAAAWTALALPVEADVDSVRWATVRFWVVRMVLTAVLVWASPWFGIYGWLGFLEAIRFFPVPAVFGALAINSLVMSGSYLATFPDSWPAFGVWIGLSAALTVLVGFFAVLSRRSAASDLHRRRTLSDVRETNQRLEQALVENRGLQTQLVTQAREAGVADERARIAREIHDTLAQTLAGVVTQIEAAERAGELRPGHTEHVDRARDLARTGLTEARRALHALRPAPLDGSRLVDALGAAAADFTERSGVPASVDIVGAPIGLPTDHEIALLRAAQEALANVEKHAHAHRVGVTISYLDDAVLLDVRDDGVGLPDRPGPPCGDGHGIGLAAMRERLGGVGGDLVLESGDGTALLARVPLVATGGRR